MIGEVLRPYLGFAKAALWLIVLGASFYAGYAYRDVRADEAIAQIEAAQQIARADAEQAARTMDHSSAQHATKTEQQRIDASLGSEANFRVIEREVVKYVQAHPDPIGCDLDGDGLRAWRAANAGRFESPEPEHPAGAVGALPASPARSSERQP